MRSEKTILLRTMQQPPRAGPERCRAGMFGLLWFDGRKPGQNGVDPAGIRVDRSSFVLGFIFNFAFSFSLLFYFSAFLFFFFTLSESGKCTAETRMYEWASKKRARVCMYGDVLAVEM